MAKGRMWVLRSVGDEFRKRCAELDIPAHRKLESLVIQWQARGMPNVLDYAPDGPLGEDWPSNKLTRFTLRREFLRPINVFVAESHGFIPKYKLVSGIISEYLETYADH